MYKSNMSLVLRGLFQFWKYISEVAQLGLFYNVLISSNMSEFVIQFLAADVCKLTVLIVLCNIHLVLLQVVDDPVPVCGYVELCVVYLFQ